MRSAFTLLPDWRRFASRLQSLETVAWISGCVEQPSDIHAINPDGAHPFRVIDEIIPSDRSSSQTSCTETLRSKVFASPCTISLRVLDADSSAWSMADLVFMAQFCQTSSAANFHVLIGPPQRKRFADLEPRIFAVIKRQPALGERSTKGSAIGIFLEPQPFKRAPKLGRHQF